MPSLTLFKPRLGALPRPVLRREKAWHTAWLVLTWACFLFACLRTWQVIQGRMYYLLDSDMCSDLVLSYHLRQEHVLLATDWFYSTELRVFHNHLVFAPLFVFFDNWLQVRTIGTAIILLGMLVSCWFFCRQAGIGHLFPAIGTVLVTPLSDVYFRITLLTVSYPPHLFASFFCLGLLFGYLRCENRRTRAVWLAVQLVFSFVIGLGGLRQVLVFYLPLALTALCLAFVGSGRDPGATLPGLALPERRLLTGSLGALVAALAGWFVNTHWLRYIYHYSSQEGIHFTAFDGARVEQLFFGLLESFGFRTGDYVTSPMLLYNAFCFLALFVVVCAYISLVRHPERYTLPERVLTLLSFFGLVCYEGVYLFTDMVYYTRYNISTVVLMIPVAVDFLYRLPRCRLWRGAALGVLAALLLWCGNDYYTQLWPKNMTASQEAAVAALRVAGYTEGYATFWNANVMVELSNGAFDMRVWTPGQDVTDPDNLYPWMQSAEHFESAPEGPVFVFLNKTEAEYDTPSRLLDQGTVEYEDEHYIALGYPSHDALLADFAG